MKKFQINSTSIRTAFVHTRNSAYRAKIVPTFSKRAPAIFNQKFTRIEISVNYEAASNQHRVCEVRWKCQRENVR